MSPYECEKCEASAEWTPVGVELEKDSTGRYHLAMGVECLECGDYKRMNFTQDIKEVKK